MQIRISVLTSGELLLDGEPAPLSAVKQALEKADSKEDTVFYYRENPQAAPPPVAQGVLNLIVTYKLPLTLCHSPDFSDYVDQFGQSHPRPLTGSLPADPFEPWMPDVDLRCDPAAIFERIRKPASAAGGAGVAIVRPDRATLLLPSTFPVKPELTKQLPSVIPSDRSYNIAAICNTRFTMVQAASAPSIADAGRAIPILGFLIGWSQAGHRVWIFEGHPSALAAGLAESEFLFVDSGMLRFLQADWMAVAKHAMAPGGKVFLHNRVKYQLLPLVATDEPPGWRVPEPDGEASYANCLLTTLAKGNVDSISIVSGKPVPGLADLTTNSEELAWISELPFRYESLDSARVIAVLLNAAAKGNPAILQSEWVLNTKLVSQDREPRIQTFLLRRERKLQGTILHVEKIYGNQA